jgi:hypothetical protein
MYLQDGNEVDVKSFYPVVEEDDKIVILTDSDNS